VPDNLQEQGVCAARYWVRAGIDQAAQRQCVQQGIAIAVKKGIKVDWNTGTDFGQSVQMRMAKSSN